MSWKGQLRGVATRGRLGDRKQCRDFGGSLGDHDMVLVSRPEASLWAEMGSQHGN